MQTIDLAYFQQLLERIQGFVREIETLEQGHNMVQCATYAPGRCLICFKVQQIERGQIKRVVFIFEDELRRLFPEMKEPEASIILDMTALLARADVVRCHARGQWPYSAVEVQETQMVIWPRLKCRLALDKLSSERQKQLLPLIKGMIMAYQQSYHTACLQRWPLQQFEYYNSPLQPGDLPAYYR